MPRYSLAHDLNYVNKSNINTKRDYRGRTALHYVAKNGHLSELERFLKTLGADVDIRDKRDHQTPLHATAAVTRGNSHYVLLKTLLDNGADANAQDKEGRTPLHLLAAHGYTKVIQLLLDHKANVNIKNYQGDTPLFEAVKGGNLEVAQLLLDSGSDLTSSSLLHEVIKNPHPSYLQVAQLLLTKGLDVNSRDSEGKTPLHCFGKKTDIRTIQLFLDYKADVNALDNNAETPLFEVVRVGHLGVAQLLINHNSNPRAVNNSGMTLLHAAAGCNLVNSHMKLCELLLDQGVDINVQDSRGRTALHYLARNVSVNTLRLFLNRGADVNISDSKGESPLFEAVRGKDVRIVQLILGNVTRMENVNNACFQDGSTVIHWAASYCKLEVVKRLVKLGADANARDLEGRTPLLSMMMNHLDSDKNFKVKLEYMLKYCDLNIVDHNNNNVLQWCKTEDSLKTILERIALLQELFVPMHPKILETILKNEGYLGYYKMCSEELVKAKGTKIHDSCLSAFHLLVDEKSKMKNYVWGFNRTELRKKFPIYERYIWNKVNAAVRMRRACNLSASVLSGKWPVFGPTHAVVKDVLEALGSKDYERFLSGI